jgi:hypothetical protein
MRFIVASFLINDTLNIKIFFLKCYGDLCEIFLLNLKKSVRGLKQDWRLLINRR